MNKIYKVIWNKVRNCYVVVSEIAKCHSKGGSSNRGVPHVGTILTTMLLASILSFGYVAPVWADGSAAVTGAVGEDTLATIKAGEGITVTADGTVITVSAEEDEALKFLKKYLQHSVDYDDPEAAGAVVDSRSDASIALGKEALIQVLADATKSVDNVAIGNNAKIYAGAAGKSTGSNTAIGSGAVTGSENIYTTQATAIGATARVYGSSGVSIGGGAQVGVNKQIGKVTSTSDPDYNKPIYAYADQGIAIGQGATVYSDRSTAIGSAASAGTRYTKTNYGSRGQAEPNTTKQATAVGYNAKATNENSSAIGANARASGKNSTAIGSDAKAAGENSTALGAVTYATGIQNVAMGEGSQARKDETIAVGFHTIAFNAEDIAVGHDTLTFGDSALAVGHLALTGMPIREIAKEDGSKYIELPRVGSQPSQINGSSRLCFQTSDGTVLLYESSVNASGVETGTYYKVKAVPDTSSNNKYGWKFVKVDADGNETTNNNLAIKYKASESTKKDVRGLGTQVNHIDYFYAIDASGNKIEGTETNPLDGGIAIGSYTVAQGEHSMALGLTTAAYGKNSIAQGLYADAYGEGAIAFGHETIAGAHAKIVPNPNIEDAHTTSFEVAKAGIVQRVLVDGSVVGVDKNNIYSIASGDNTVEVNSLGVVLTLDGTAFGYDKNNIALASDSLVKVSRDDATGYYYYEKDGKKVLVGSDELLTFTGSNGQTVDLAAGKMTLASGGISIGSYSHAEGDRSLAIGRVAGAYDKNSTALGLYANALGEGSMAIGHNASAGAKVTITENPDNPDHHTVAIQLNENGEPVASEGIGGISVGSYSHAEGDRSLAIGRVSGAYGNNSAAIGLYANALGEGAMALGHGTVTGAKNIIISRTDPDDPDSHTITMGLADGNPESNGTYGAIAIGSYSHATGERSMAIGRVSGAYNENGTAIGLYSNAYGEGAVAIGHNATAGAEVTIKADQLDPDIHTAVMTLYDAEGNVSPAGTGKRTTKTDGTTLTQGGIAIGSYAHAVGDRSIAFGRVSGSYGENSTAMGIYSNALGQGAIAVGHGSSTGVKVTVNAGGADDFWTTTLNTDPDTGNPVFNTKDGGIAIGSYAHTEGTRALAVGRVSGAYGTNSTVFGLRSNAYGEGSMAFGHGVQAGKDDPADPEHTRYATQIPALHNDPTIAYDLDGKDSIGVNPNNVIGAIALGSYAEATGRGSLSVGRYSMARSAYSTTLGIRASVLESAENAIAIGRESKVEPKEEGRTYGGLNSIAIGTLANVKGQNSIAIGTADMLSEDGTTIVAPENRKATAVTGDSSIAIGKNDTITGNSSIAIGTQSEVNGQNSIAVGTGHTVRGDNSGAFGDPDNVYANASYAVGNNNTIGVEDDSTKGINTFVMGNNVTTTKDGTVVVGHHAEGNGHTFGENSVSLGTDAVASTDNSVAFGNNASAGVAGGVALGSNSVADTDKEVAGYDPVAKAASTKTDATWKSTAAAVSVGGSTITSTDDEGNETTTTITRQITNVAAGYQDTDAVNVAQLKAARVELQDGTNTTVTKTQDGTDGHTIYKVNVDSPVHFYSVNSTDSTKGNYDNKGAKGADALAAGVDAKAAGDNAIAIGTESRAKEDGSIAIGNGAKAKEIDAIAIGTGATAKGVGSIALGRNGATAVGRDAMAWGVNTKAKGDESTAWGVNTKAKGDGSTAFGFETVAKGEYSTAWGEQTKAVGESATAWGLNAVAKGDDATAWGNETKAVGVDSTAWGIQTRAKGLASTAFGYYSKAKGDMSTAWGSGSQAIGNSSTAFGVASTAYGRNSLAALGGTTGSEADEVTAVSSVAIGKNAIAAKDHTYAIGQDALAQDENTIAMGNSVVAAGKNAVAIGSGEITRQIGTLIETDRPGEPTAYSFTDGNGTAREIQEDEAGIYYENDEGTKIYLNKNEIVKRTDNSDDYDAEDLITTTTYLITEAKNPAQASGENAIALGTSANASGKNSIAVGTRSAASAENTVAFGNNASATVADGVALGSESVANTDKGVAGYDPVTGVASTKTTDPTWQSTAAAVSVGGGTVDGKTVTRQITNVAAGTNDTDAVNVAQLKKVAEAAGGALKFGGDNTTPDTYIERKSGQALDIKGGANTEPANLTDGNIAVVSNGRDTLNIKLAKDVDLTEAGSLKVGKTKIEDAGITIQPASGSVLTKFTNAGISAGNQQINNVAAGTADTDAVNVSQLTKAAAAAKTKVVKGTNIASVDPTTGDDGQTIYMVNADGASVSKGSDAVTVTAGAKDTETNITDYKVDLSEATKATLNKVETRGLTFKGDSGSSEEIKLGDTLNVTGGATGTLTEGNIGVEADGTDLKVKLADNINLTKAGSVTIGTAAEGATVISQKGIRIIPATGDAITEFTAENISAGGQQIHKVKAGTADDDAVNVSQLKAAKEEAIGSVKLKFRGETGDEVVRGNNETLQVVGDGTNITTKSEDNKIKVELAKDLKVDSVTAGNTVINNEGVKADKVTVGDTVIEDGKVSVGTTTIKENNITMGDTTITNKSVTSKTVEAEEVTAGNTTINNDGVTTNKVTVGDTTINSDGLTIDGGPSVTKDGIDAGDKKITGVAAGVAGTDAVNVDQLKEATSGLRTEVKGGTNIASVEHTTGEKGQSIYTVNAEGASVSAADGGAVTVTGAKDTATNITNYKIDLSDTAKASLDKVEKDGLTFKGDTGTSNKIKLGDTLNVKGGASGALSDGNIGVEGSGDTLNIKLAKDIQGVDTLQVNKSVKVGNTTIEDNKMTMGDTVITNSGVTANRFTAGDTTVSNDGVTIANGPSVTKKGVDAGGQKVTNVAPGEADTDAANMGQLRELADNAGNAINNVSNEVNRLDGRMKKGLAGAAALAALHPMDFDPDDKLTFAAGMGNYRGQNAAAIGAFYRPDEKIMFSVGGTVGNGENMVNAGVSFALDRVNRVTTSRTAMAHEIVELKKHIAHQDSQIAQLTQLVNKLVGPEQQIQNTSMFPDVPENHWAYAYLEDLQKRGIVEGYPDGQFRGDRSMTRYEFAALLDRALRKGEELDARIAKEFEPELGRIYVERIKGQDNDRHKIERVRVNNTDTRTRDVYGTKIS